MLTHQGRCEGLKLECFKRSSSEPTGLFEEAEESFALMKGSRRGFLRTQRQESLNFHFDGCDFIQSATPVAPLAQVDRTVPRPI